MTIITYAELEREIKSWLEKEYPMKRYEGSKADMTKDRKMAKAKGISMKAWEKSAMDKRMDAAGQRKLDAKRKKK